MPPQTSTTGGSFEGGAAVQAGAVFGAGPTVAAGGGLGPAASSIVCAQAATPVSRPTALPSQVPLPSDAVLTGTEERSGGRLPAVTSGKFHETLAFMRRAYPAAGLTLKEGEVEDRDAESNFTGNGLVGRWTLREIPDCHGDTLVTVLVARP